MFALIIHFATNVHQVSFHTSQNIVRLYRSCQFFKEYHDISQTRPHFQLLSANYIRLCRSVFTYVPAS